MSWFPIFLASLLGSTHCAAMCGGFVGLYSGTAPTQSQISKPLSLKARSTPHLSYNLGRLVTYVVAGFFAGLFAERLDMSSESLGFARISALIFGGIVVLLGLIGLFRTSQATPSPLLHSLLSPIMRRSFALANPSMRAFSIGLCSTLLPCGWLYAFIAFSATTGDALRGATLMFVFWLGTLPMMLTAGMGASYAIRLMGKYSHRITSVLIIAGGLSAIALHSSALFDAPGVHNPGADGRSLFQCVPPGYLESSK